MKILVIKLGALGDVVMATPLLEAIQLYHSDAKIDLLTTPAFAPIFSSWSGITVHAFQRSGITAMIKMLRFVKNGHYDRIYDLQGNDRSGLLCAFSKAEERVGNHTRFPYTHHPIDKWEGKTHIFTRMKRVLASAGVTVVREVPILPTTSEDRRLVSQWRQNRGLGDKPFVVLHASASAKRPEKCWPFFDALAKRLIKTDLTPVWLGADADRELNVDRCRRIGGTDASGVFTIPQLAEFSRSARFAVANDSGPMHALAASEIPVFGLFGPSDWRRNHALGQANHVITSPAKDSALDGISANLVWQRLVAANAVPALS